MKIIASSYRFWRDVLQKRHPELVEKIHRYLKARHPNLAMRMVIPRGVDAHSLKGYRGRVSYLARIGAHDQAEALAQEGIMRFRPAEGGVLSEDYRELLGYYAQAAEARSDWSTAMTRWRERINLERKNPDARSYGRLIQASLMNGEVESADRVMKESLALLPPIEAKRGNLSLFDHPLFGEIGIPDLFLSVALIRDVYRYLSARGVRLLIVTHPHLRGLNNLSRHEHDILRGDKSQKDGIAHAHADLPYCDEDYVKAVNLRGNVTVRDGVLVNGDMKSLYVNFEQGRRYTTDQPDHYEQTVYCVGSSRYCHYSEDRYTIPSCLQRVLNQHNLAIRVVNVATAAARIQHQVAKIRHLEVKTGDTVLLEFQYDRKLWDVLESVLSSLGIQWHNFADDFRESRSDGVMFIDKQHINYRGNEEIAQRLYDRFFSAYPLLQSPGCAWAEKMLQAVDQGRFPDGAAAQTDPMQAQIDTAYADVPVFHDGTVGAIVMNCNPITRGHMHLITLASQIVKHLYVFVVEEDRSAFSFADRLEMIRRATASLPHVVVVPSGRFILSVETFPEYFEKDMKQEAIIDTSQDIGIFGRYVARRFGITLRFVGEEPTDKVTRQYNAEMKASLPQYGVQVLEIPRLESGGEAISASRVRALLREQQWDAVAAICPSTTVDYLREMVQQGRLTV